VDVLIVAIVTLFTHVLSPQRGTVGQALELHFQHRPPPAKGESTLWPFGCCVMVAALLESHSQALYYPV
jgi:hypothetical protein